MMPSSKEFKDIITFMLRLDNPNFQVDSNAKFDDEVCLHLKLLGYPVTISKTSLSAAGAKHTWPNLLAALSWLAEHLQLTAGQEEPDYLNGPVEPFETLQESYDRTDKAFYQYLSVYYSGVVQGMDDDSLEQIEATMQARFEAEDALLGQFCFQAIEYNNSLEDRIQQLEEENDV
jgi:kinetochore protein NDC80